MKHQGNIGLRLGLCVSVCFSVDGWLGLFKHGIGERARETARDDREEVRDNKKERNG